MLRRLATFLLLVPLSLNGLWMICTSVEAPADSSETAQAEPVKKEHCEFMCPTEKPVQPGATCVLTAGTDGSSIALFAVAVATPPSPMAWTTPPAFADYPQRPAVYYSDPTLALIHPPPEA